MGSGHDFPRGFALGKVHKIERWEREGRMFDEAFFLGGISKREVLKSFGANIFFDDQEAHTLPASEVVPTARVPCLDAS